MRIYVFKVVYNILTYKYPNPKQETFRPKQNLIKMYNIKSMNPRDKKKARQLEAKQKQKQVTSTRKLLQQRYLLEDVIGKGVSSQVISAIDMRTGKRVAVKKIKRFLENKYESLRVLREILLLRKLKHPNLIDLKEIILEQGDPQNLALILEYLPSDIKKIFNSNRMLSMRNIKQIVFQILVGLNYCQQSQVLHRDLKPENILITNDLSQVKLCDFGLARAVAIDTVEKMQAQEPVQKMQQPTMKMQQNNHQYKSHLKNLVLTAHVSTRWYRAPELILLERNYNSAIDIWSIGCILGQLMTMLDTSFTERKPLFPGKACYPLSPPKTSDMNYKKINDFPHSVYDQLSVIFGIIGTPTDIDFITDERAKNYIRSFDKIPKRSFKEVFKFVSSEVQDFLQKSLQFNPNKRMTITQALNHKLFDDIRSNFQSNLSIKGQPIVMNLEGIDIDQIRQIVLEEYKFYSEKKG